MKAHLASPPLLSMSQPNEKLSLYLAISPTAVSSALIREDDQVQLPIYYSSRAFRGVDKRYPSMEKLAFTLITTKRKLRPHFQANTIVVQIDKPLRKIMNNLEAARQLVLWTIELSEFDVQYWPSVAIKAQALANFVVKFTTKNEGWWVVLGVV